MTISLEVHPHIVLEGHVVQVLHPSLGTGHRHSQRLVDVVSGGTVGIGSLYQTKFEGEVSLTNKVLEVAGNEGGYLVAVYEVILAFTVNIGVDYSIGITIHRHTAAV